MSHHLPPELGPTLLALARGAIREHLGLPGVTCSLQHPVLKEAGACFVTLTLNGELRGCIGHLQPMQPLGLDVRENAVAAAFQDFRFAPLTARELDQVRIEVSLLGPTIFTPCPSREQCLRTLEPFVDGVILRSGSHQATFLPQVWEDLPEPEAFINHLLRKARLPETSWPADMQLGRYQVQHVEEAQP